MQLSTNERRHSSLTFAPVIQQQVLKCKPIETSLHPSCYLYANTRQNYNATFIFDYAVLFIIYHGNSLFSGWR